MWCALPLCTALPHAPRPSRAAAWGQRGKPASAAERGAARRSAHPWLLLVKPHFRASAWTTARSWLLMSGGKVYSGAAQEGRAGGPWQRNSAQTASGPALYSCTVGSARSLQAHRPRHAAARAAGAAPPPPHCMHDSMRGGALQSGPSAPRRQRPHPQWAFLCPSLTRGVTLLKGLHLLCDPDAAALRHGPLCRAGREAQGRRADHPQRRAPFSESLDS